VRKVRIISLILAGAIALCLIGLRRARTQITNPRRVTNTSEEGISLNPSISGDGRIISFESTRDVAGAGGTDHFRAIRANVAVDPAAFFQMGGTRAVAPALSQDGSRIAFASKDDPLGTNADGNSEIFLLDGSKLTQVTNTAAGAVANRVANGNFQPSISDDGRFIAFCSNRDLAGRNSDGNLEIFIYDTLAINFTQLTNTSGIVGSSDAKISGDGGSVVYILDNGAAPSAKRDLMQQTRVDLSGAANVLAANVQSLAMTYGRAVSDDGTRIVYSAETAPNTTQVFLFDRRVGGATRQITSLGARTNEVPLHPTISGDGTRVAFAARRSVPGAPSNSDGSVELYVLDLPSSQISKITNAPAAATADVVSSLNDDGSIVAVNFPRILSGALTNGEMANNSEIYMSGTPSRPPFGSLTILNGASFGKEPSTSKAVAPDSIAMATGSVLANSTQQSQKLPNGTFPTNVAGTTVTVNGRAAQIFFVSPGQVNFLVPPETEIGAADVVITNSENFPSRGTVPTLRSAPGVFTNNGDGSGPGVILNSDTLQEGPFDPTRGDLRLTIFTTGARNASQNSVIVGGRVINAEGVIASPDMPGLDEVHVVVPRDLRGAGTVDLFVQSDGRAGNPVSVTFTGDATRDILINEALADPPDGIAGDANHDGVRDSSDDEFIELVNTTAHDIDISGYQLSSRSSSTITDTLRHRFAGDTILPACSAVLVFGGGKFDSINSVFGDAQVFKATSGSLALTNGGGMITLRDSASAIITSLTWGGSTGLTGDLNQSMTRSPDVTGRFVLHQAAIGSAGRSFTPGTQADGAAFSQCNSFVRIDITPPLAAIDAGAKQQFTAKAFNASGSEVPGVIFTWQSGNTVVATIDQNGLATGSKAGSTDIKASAHGIQSASATLTVHEVARMLTRIDVTPQSATIPATGAQQFTAHGIDQFGNEIAGLPFTWESANTGAAIIDQAGLATGVAQGQSTIKAISQGVNGTADLNVTSPMVVINEVLADPPNGTDGDANHDGTRDSAQDEFVELVNSTGSAVNISGWTVRTHSITSFTETVRHTFVAGASLSGGEAIAIFGGGTINANAPLFGCAQVVKASSGGLSLTNSGLSILVRDGSGNLITQFSYGGTTGLNGGNAQSLTRSPDVNGNFVLHTTIAGARKFSSGLKIDGTPFGKCAGHPATVTISPLSASIDVGQTTSFTAQAFDQFGRAMIGVAIVFASDNSSVATIDSVSINPFTGIAAASVRAHNPGTAHITASGADGTTTAHSTQSTLTVSGPSLTINNISLNEGNSGITTFTFIVSLSTPAPAGGVTFDISTQDGTATTANNDYVARSLTGQTIAAGQSAYTFDVTVNGDATIEPNETFLANVTNVFGASIGDGQGVGTIINDDSPSLKVSDISANEGDSGPTTFTVTVSSTLPAPAGGITFDIATADGTATATSGDYVSRSLTGQTIPAGQTGYTFDVTVNGDTLVEPNETFSVNITNVSNAGITDGSGLVTIQNDDTATLVISQVYGVGDNSGAALRNDFVEIYNHGATTVDFSIMPYSIQYASVGSNFGTNKTNLTSGTMAPGRYFLIQEAGGTTNGSALPAPDATGTINLSNTAGKVALVAGTTALASATCPGDDGVVPFNPSNAAVADFVGYGNSASTAGHCYEDTGPASSPSNTTADLRKAGGCVDTNDNASDFLVASPNPRNSNSPVGDCQPEITINDLTVTEGNTGSVNATFTVALSTSSSQAVTVNYATADGTATAPADYQSISGLLTFNPGDITRTITVPINGDTLDEPSETFFVDLSNATNGVLLDNQGQGTITDNDPAPSLSINDLSVAEGDAGTTTATFTVTLSAASGQTITVNYANADNTALAGSDYQATSGTLIFHPGDNTRTVTVLVNGDMTFEENETFFVNLTSPTNASISDAQGRGTIINDDAAPPTPTLSINDVAITEGDSGASIAIFNVTLSPASNQAVTVDFATANGTATSGGNDYQSVTGLLTFNPGDTIKPIGVTVNGDILVEPVETFFVNLTSATGGAVIGDSQGLGTIQNDDTALLAISQLYGGGGNGGASFQNDFVEILNRGTTTIDFAVTSYSVQYASSSGTFNSGNKVDLINGMLAVGQYYLVKLNSGGPVGATFAADLTNTGVNLSATDGKVALVAGTTVATTTSGCPTGVTLADLVGYGGANCSETMATAALSATKSAVRKSNGCTDTDSNLADFITSALNAVTPPRNTSSPLHDCNAPPDLTFDDVSAMEGNSGTTTLTFTLSLAAPAPALVTFDISTQDNTATVADNDYVARSLAGQTIAAGQQTYTFDVTVNGDVNVEPNESFFVNVTNVSGATIVDSQGVGTIQNDDIPALSINDVSLNESDSGNTNFSFTVSLSQAAPAGGVTFDIATADGTATTGGSDYVARTLTGQTIPAGQSSYTFEVAVNGDTVVEANETFVVNVINVSGATVLDGSGQGTIQNDDTPLIAISQVYGGGGNSGATFRNDFIEVFNRGTTTIDLAGWSVQYASATGTTWSVTPLCSTGPCLLLPGRYFLVQENQGAGGSTDLPSPDATGTIAMTSGSGKVAIASNTSPLTGPCPTGPRILDFVGYGTTANCFEGSTAPAPGNATADIRKGGGCVDTQDNAVDFFVHTPEPRNSSIPANACSGQTADISISDVTVKEGDSGTLSAGFTVSLIAASASTVTVDYATANGTASSPADYQAIPTTTFTFTPGEVSRTINVHVNGDTLDEPDESFFVNLTHPTNAAILDGQGQGTIVDDDVPPTLTIDDISQNEGNSGSTTFHFVVTLSAPALTGGVTFDIATQDGTASVANNDYVPKALTVQTIPVGNTSFALDVTVNSDTNIEPDETFFVNVTNVSGATVSNGQGKGTIQNDDSPTLSINSVAVTEGDTGTTPATLTVTLSPSSTQIVTVDYATSSASPATATAGTDYVVTNGALTFNPGETSKPIIVQVKGDTVNEAICETFFVNLSNPANATIAPAAGQGTVGVTDDDGTKLIITQIYGGGSNSGATFRNDFVEIFNRGATTVDFSTTNYSVQYASAAGSFSSGNTISLTSGTVAPGQFFLIKLGPASPTIGTALPAADATNTGINMSATDGKVALVVGAALATTTNGCPTGVTVADLIGYGNANCSETTATAVLSAAKSAKRSASCKDTNNNSTDFTVVSSPSPPRNTSTTLSPCSCSTSYSSLFSLGRDSWKGMLAGLFIDRPEFLKHDAP
jgi:Tol biopolymer transport system component